MRQLKCILFLFILILIIGVYINNSNDSTFIANEEANSLSVNGYTIENAWQWSLSQDQKFLLYSKSLPNIAPDMYWYCFDTKTETRLTSNKWYTEEYPAVNNQGDYAFAQYYDLIQPADIIINGNRLPIDNASVVTGIILNESYLLAAYKVRANEQVLAIYNLIENDFTFCPIPGGLNRMAWLDNTHVVLEIFGYATNSIDIFVYSLTDNYLQVVANSSMDELFACSKSSNGFSVLTIQGTANARYLFNSYYTLYSNQYFNPFSIANDFSGRLSWNQGARLDAMAQLYQVTGDKILLQQIQKAVDNILSTTNQHYELDWQYNHPNLWTQIIYSADRKTNLSTFVENAYLLYNLLKTANLDILPASQQHQIISLSTEAFAYYNSWYDPYFKGYRTPKGVPCNYDGILRPWNQQNIFALLCMELYIATDEFVYKERAQDLATAFKRGFMADDDRLLWRYWSDPLIFEGWTIDDNISYYVPNCTPWDPTMTEDVGYAGINITFMLTYQKYFGDDIFTKDDMARLHRTYLSLVGNKTPQYLDGRGEDNPLEATLGSGWINLPYSHKLKEKWLNLGYYKCANSVSNCVDALANYVQCIEYVIPQEELLTITIQNYDTGLNPSSVESKLIIWEQIATFAKQYVLDNGIC